MTLLSKETERDKEHGSERAAMPTVGEATNETSPFAPEQPRPIARRLGIVGFAAAVALAMAAVYLTTRNKAETTTPAAHVHGAPPANEMQAVMLTAGEAQRIGVTYASASLSPLAIDVRTVAQVTYDETRVKTIAPKLDGWVDQLYVNITGQAVRAGEPLLAIYSPMVVATEQELLLSAQLEKDMAAASPDARRGTADLRAAARRRLLYWDIAPDDIDRIERTGEVQKTVVLRSPVHGVVLERNVLSGQKIMAGDALFKVADLSVVWVEGEVFERDLAAVRLGQVVRSEFQALPGATRTGRITYIYPTVSTETRTVRVRVELANGDLALKPGMYATILIRGTDGTPVLNVPRSAVLSTGERALVFVRRDDGMLEPRNITVGLANDDRIQVLSGLRAGEIVVKSATFLVDAESNLGSALGGMGDMPGMDLTTPRTSPPPKAGNARRD